MSAALERVIAEQQEKIDRLERAQESNSKEWQRQHERTEKLVRAAFGMLNSPDEYRSEMLNVLVEQGWCVVCELETHFCECD